MARNDLTLHLLVPGLFGPFPRKGLSRPELPPLPGIERLLARGRSEPFHASGGAAGLLFALFGVRQPDEGAFPEAALRRLGDGLATDDACWIHADPVFLRADRDRLLLFDAERIGLDSRDAQELVLGLRHHGLDLEFTFPERWYLRLDRKPDLVTSPLEEVAGRSLDPYLPRGRDGAAWRSRLNEAQMLLHHSPVNERREAQGLPRVNSLWFWGAGALPQAPRKPPFSGVSANCVLARGLARWSGVRLTEVPEGLFAWPSEDRAGDWLVILGDLRRSVLDADLSAWAEALHRLEQGWFAPMSSWLRQNPSCRVFLYPASGDRFAVSARLLRRCWRRSRPLMGYLRGEDRERLFL